MGQQLSERFNFDYTIVEDVQGRPLRVGGEMQLADRPNLNRRKYPESLWTRVLGMDKTQARLRERRMLGLLDHPADGKTKLEWPGPSHVMTSLEMRESVRFPGTKAVYGVYECLPTPSGKVLEALLRSGIGIQVSSRGDGEVESGGDGYSTVIPESYDLDTFDVVIDPSVNTDVRVLENAEKSSECACKVPTGKTTEAIVEAVYGIVQKGGYGKDCAAYYKRILESALPGLESETYLKADEALSSLNQTLEVSHVTKTNEQVTAEAQTSATLEQLRAENQRLKTENADLAKKNVAGVKAVEALMVQSRIHKMQAETYAGQVKGLEEKAGLYEAAKEVIRDLRSAVKEMEEDAGKVLATEQFLAAVLSRIDESKRHAYIERMLSSEPVKVREALRPLLRRCQSRREVNESLLAHKKAASGGSRDRSLPPVNESGRRTAKIAPTSPIMETRGRHETGRVVENGDRNGRSFLDEQVDFTKKLVKNLRG